MISPRNSGYAEKNTFAVWTNDFFQERPDQIALHDDYDRGWNGTESDSFYPDHATSPANK